MATLAELEAKMKSADAEVTRIMAEETARREQFVREIAAARETAFAATAAWQAAARAEIERKKP